MSSRLGSAPPFNFFKISLDGAGIEKVKGGLKEMGKFLWAGWKKFCPVGCLSLDLLSQKFFWKMQKKVWYYEKWVGCHASFPPRTFAKG